MQYRRLESLDERGARPVAPAGTAVAMARGGGLSWIVARLRGVLRGVDLANAIDVS